MKVNGKVGTYYHENITPQKNNQAMNIYVEEVTIEKKKAKIFFDKEEAEKIGVLFASKFHISIILTIK